MKHAKLSLILLFSIIFSSCSIISFEKIIVDCNIPVELNYFTQENITLIFSIAPDTKDIEHNVRLTVNNATTECDFTWDKNVLNIRPKTGWQYGSVYEFSITNSLRMEDNRHYKVDIRRIFYYGNQEEYLQLSKCNIKNDEVIKKDSQLEFTFNKPVDIISFKNNFSISPTVTYTLKFTENNKKVIITPVDGWITNSYYTWIISDITASDKYPLKKTYSQSFYAPQDTVKPEIQYLYPVSKNGEDYNWLTNKTLIDMNYDNHLGIVFTEPVEFDTLKNAFTITPNIDGYLIPADSEGTKFIYCIQTFWNAQTEYEIKISNSLKDKNNIPLYEDFITYFKPANSLFHIEKVTVVKKSIPTETTDITEFNETPVYIPLDETTDVYVKIKFSKNVDDKYKPIAVKNTSLNSFFPSTAVTPVVISTQWENDDSTLQIQYKGFSASTTEVKNYYKLTVSGGSNSILDENGNFLEEDLCVYIITWQL